MHLVKQLDCRSSEGSSILLGGAVMKMGCRVMVTAEPPKLQREGPIPSHPAMPGMPGTIVQPGEHYLRTVEIGVRVPVVPPNGPKLVGYQPGNLTQSPRATCPFTMGS